MSPARKHIGEIIREKRLAKGLTLRKFAALLDVSPTYVSLFEQGDAPPPTDERLRQIAKVLGEDPDELIAMAGRVPEGFSKAVQQNPQEMATFLREVSGLTAEQIAKLTQQARRLKSQQHKDP